jgi:hypothetical protein
MKFFKYVFAAVSIALITACGGGGGGGGGGGASSIAPVNYPADVSFLSSVSY